MKKLFVLFLLSAFLTPLNIISTEKRVKEAPSHIQYQLMQTFEKNFLHYKTIPKRPLSLFDLISYRDSDLTVFADFIPAKTPLNITDFLINEQSQPVFQLSDGTYVMASQLYITSDTALSVVAFEADFWLEKGFFLYQEPYYVGAQALPTSLQSYTKVHVTKKAQTIHGTAYYIAGQGWVAEAFLSAKDNRMTEVQSLLESKYKKENISVYVQQISSGESAAINQDKVMYAASVTKLPLLYYVQDQLDQGKIALEDKLKYTEQVHDFAGAFNPAGSGSISKTADNEEYRLEELIKKVAQESDNVATNILAYYVADKYGKDYQQFVSDLPDWSMTERETTAVIAAQFMLAIYEQGGVIINYLSHTCFDDQRIARDIDVQVAHKIGDADDFRHDVAIVYAKEPFILSIFTENASYDDISAIARDIYTILK